MGGSATGRAIEVEALGMTMRFGGFLALDDVSMRVAAGSFHALLGENGAGKSTLVKCMLGYQKPSDGQMLVDGREAKILGPRDAATLWLGMVYQHFTLAPSLTGAENLVIARADGPFVIDWRKERAALAQFMESMPFRVPLDRPVGALSTGERQKLEIAKQLYLGRRFLVLDEPTSALTPDEAEEVLGHVRALTRRGGLTALMISHKFREVFAFADDVTVLRKGRRAGGGAISALDRSALAAMMIGEQKIATLDARAAVAETAEPVLEIRTLRAPGGAGRKSIEIDDLVLHAGEIVGVAGIAGNGQRELLDVLAGQRAPEAGKIRVKGSRYGATRAEMKELNVRFIPEEPLRNACAPLMSVAENLAFRTFDLDRDGGPKRWLDGRAIRRDAERLVDRFEVKAASIDAPIATLSGGNVQRAVLARELTGNVDLLIVANPCFGLDFAAVAEIRARIMQARNAGAAVLLVSEDLDELLELSDRILVMSEGAIVYETPIAAADAHEIGRHMAGRG